MAQICKALIQKDVSCPWLWFRNHCILCSHSVTSKCCIMKRLGTSSFVMIPQHSLPHLGTLLTVLRLSKRTDAIREQSCEITYIQTSQGFIWGCPNEKNYLSNSSLTAKTTARAFRATSSTVLKNFNLINTVAFHLVSG